MTKENLKQLLLQELSARLPYGVKVLNTADGLNEVCVLDSIMTSWKNKDNIFVGLTLSDDSIMTGIEMVKPYLRQMSSMTEEEMKEYTKLWNLQEEYPSDLDIQFKIDLFDWLNQHHFDYRGLIKKGLALEAPDGMYN